MRTLPKATAATLLFLLSCSNSHVDLVGGFQSYTPIERVEGELRQGGFEWTEVERNETPASSSGDPFSFVRLKVDVYKLAQATGELELSFFNSQLMRVSFCPESSQDLERLESASEIEPQGSARRGPVRMRWGVDHRGKPFLSWEDERLVDEMNTWIRRRG